MEKDLDKILNNKLISLPEKRKAKKITKIIGYLTGFVFTVLIVFSSQILMTGQESTSWISRLPIIGYIKKIVEGSDKKLKGEEDGRINILLLGMGGKNHEGGMLTDTIMLVSLNPVEKKAAILSIPRDLSVPIEGRGWRKINNVNAYAEVQSAGSGGLATSQTVSDILDIPIDYYVRIDFQGFINIIDELGGINVYIDNVLEDKRYPVMGKEEDPSYENRYEHLYIDKGWQTMDGDLALKYVRSRHAYGAEGSDFARSKRQQKVLEAAKEKFLSKNTLFNPKTIADIIGELNDHVSTNLKAWEMIKLWNTFKDIEGKDIVNKGLNNSPNGLLVDMISEEGAYLLTPRSGDFTEIQYMVSNLFSDAPTKTKERVVTEVTAIEILNGTWINGLASKVALDLEKFGFEVVRLSNYSRQDFEKSVIYDLTYGEKINSLTVLKEKTNADISFGLPEWLIADLAKKLEEEKDVKQPDFILILGKNADTSASGAENPEK